VFCTRTDGRLKVTNVLRDLHVICKKAGLVPEEWTAQELRHTFVSLLSASGVPIKRISRLVDQDRTRLTESVYRHQIRSALEAGATAMDQIFPKTTEDP
jgi:site-specific recombinase XerD